jgi:hypothetical protein
VSVFTDFEVVCFIDYYKDDGTKIKNIPVYHVDTFLKRYSDIPIVLSLSPYSQSYEFVYNQLLESGIPESLIYNLKDWECDMQYFDFFERDPSVSESFVDAGAFDGSTVKSFLNWCSGDYERIIAFEPDEENYKKVSGKRPKMTYVTTPKQRIAENNINQFLGGFWKFFMINLVDSFIN